MQVSTIHVVFLKFLEMVGLKIHLTAKRACHQAIMSIHIQRLPINVLKIILLAVLPLIHVSKESGANQYQIVSQDVVRKSSVAFQFLLLDALSMAKALIVMSRLSQEQLLISNVANAMNGNQLQVNRSLHVVMMAFGRLCLILVRQFVVSNNFVCLFVCFEYFMCSLINYNLICLDFLQAKKRPILHHTLLVDLMQQ